MKQERCGQNGNEDKESRFEKLRRKAEALVDEKATEEVAASLDDVKELIHQLTVYQIELELQNEELVSAQSRLEASRNKYIRLYDFAPIAYFTFDEEGLISESNLAGAGLLSMDRCSLAGKPFITYLHTDSQKTYYLHRQSVFRDGAHQTCMLTLRLRNGEERIVRMNSVLVDDPYCAERFDSALGPAQARLASDSCRFMLSAVEDITDLKRTEELLSQAKDASEKANEAKSEFMARMSHELRTPLNGILGLTQVVIDSELDSEQETNLHMVKDSAVELLNIVNDILDVSKVEMGVLSLQERKFSLRALVEDCVYTFENAAQTKGLDYNLSITPEMDDEFMGDPLRIKQVLTNLLSNAIKFTPEGSISVSVSRDARLDKCARQFVRFEVSDTGIGIPEKLIDNIFERFYQVDGSFTRSFEGTGLGLAIAKSLVEMMDGVIEVRSTQDKGSVFTVTLPLTTAAEAAAKESLPPECQQHARESEEAAAEELKAEKEPASSLPPLTVLLAEDNAVNQAFAQLILRREGHEVVTVGNGKDALEVLSRQAFDVVLMDVRMPGMDGVEATKRIRSGDACVLDAEIPIVAMTAHTSIEDRELFLSVGMDCYVSKPMNWEQILEAIAEAMQVRGRSPRT